MLFLRGLPRPRIGICKALHDSRVLDKLGGFAEWQNAWRRYDYSRDHDAMVNISVWKVRQRGH